MKKSAYEDLSEKLKAIAHPVRIRIILALAENEHAVFELCDILDISQSVISQHLSTLRVKGIVVGRRDGTSICYRISSTSMKTFLTRVLDGFDEYDNAKPYKRRNIARA